MARSIVSVWHGVYLVEGGRTIASREVPVEPHALEERMRARAEGRLTPEEAAVLEQQVGTTWSCRDRRLVGAHGHLDPDAPGDVDRAADPDAHRTALLAAAERALEAAWDPSVHVEEAVRSLRDVDRALNLLGERLAAWASHDTPGTDPDQPEAAARGLLAAAEPGRFGPVEPKIADARRHLARIYLDLKETRKAVEEAVTSAAPVRTPNLSELLGPDLASRLVAQAGGLDRLARMPASTVQVLGAEKAFFEHLRGRAPPPRHGLLFLHPSIQTAPRAVRGRLARSLAAKAAIAARLDRAARPVDASLKASYERRRAEVRRARPERAGRPPRGRSRPPLDRAAEHR